MKFGVEGRVGSLFIGSDSMGYIYNAVQLRTMNKQLVGTSSSLMAAVESVSSAIDNVAETDAMKGQGATTIQNYLSQVHQTCICVPLLEVINDIEKGFADYYSRYIAFDANKGAVINTDELSAISKNLTDALAQLKSAETEMFSAMSQVSDVSNQKYSGMDDTIETKIYNLSNNLNDLSEQITSLETTGCAEAQSLQDFLNAIGQTMYQYLIGKFDLLSYDTKDLVSSEGYSKLCTSLSALKALSAKWDERAERTNELIADVEQQWEKRQTTAKSIKTGLAIIETVASGVAVYCDPVGAAVITGIASGVNGFVSEIVDQWSSGEWATRSFKDNLCDVMWETSIGTLEGVAKGFVGATIAKVFPDPTFIQGVGKNFVNEMVEVPFELMDALYEGNYKEKWEEITSDEYRLELVGECVTDTIIDKAADEILDPIGNAISSKVTGKDKKIIFDTLWKTGADSVEQKVEDSTDVFVETLFSGGNDLEVNLGEATTIALEDFSDFSDFDEIVTEKATGAMFETTSVYAYENLYQDDPRIRYEERVDEAYEKAYKEKLEEVEKDPDTPWVTEIQQIEYEQTVSEELVFVTEDSEVLVLEKTDYVKIENATVESYIDPEYMDKIEHEVRKTAEEKISKEDEGKIKSFLKSIGTLIKDPELDETKIAEIVKKRIEEKTENCLDRLTALQQTE